MSAVLQAIFSNVVIALALAVLVHAVTRIWRDPHLAHALWLLVLLKLVTPPLVRVPVPVLGSKAPPELVAAARLAPESATREPAGPALGTPSDPKEAAGALHDIEQLLSVLLRLRDEGNTIVVIEHNLDVIKTGDWVIDLGPEGGAGGGRMVAAGTPEEVARVPQSHTGRYLRRVLEPSPSRRAAS